MEHPVKGNQLKQWLKDDNNLSFAVKRKRKGRSPNNYALQVSAMLDIYRINFVENLRYILKYTGMSLKGYHALLLSCGIKGMKTSLNDIKKAEYLGFDLFIVAAAAGIFRLPVELLFLCNIRHEKINLLDYGLIPDFYIKKDGLKSSRTGFEAPTNNTIARKNLLRRAIKNNKQPARIVSARKMNHIYYGEQTEYGRSKSEEEDAL